MRTQHQARQSRPLAFVAAADVADRVEMRAHAGRPHPGQDQVGRGAMFPGEEDPRQMLRRLRDRGELVDAADDLLAERRFAARPLPLSSHSCFSNDERRAGSHVLPNIDTSSVPAVWRIRSNALTGISPARLTSPEMIASASRVGFGTPIPGNDCLTPLHTMQKSRLNFSHFDSCTSFKSKHNFDIISYYFNAYINMPTKHALARSLRHPVPGSAASGEAAKLAAVHPPKEQPMDFGRISRRHLLQGSAALTLGSALGVRSAAAADTTIGFIYVGSRDDYGYNQAHAAGAAALKKMPGLKVVEEEKVAGDRRGRKDHGVDDQSRRRDAAVPDLVRLLQPAHDQDGDQVSEAALRALRRPVERQGPEERRQLFRLYRRGPVYLRHRRRLLHQIRQARLRRRQADPAGAAQHQRLHARRQARQPEGHHAGDLHRRLVDAGQGSRSHQQPDRPGRRRPDLSRRRTEDHGGERRAPRRHGVRLSRQPVAAGAEGLPHRRRMELGSAVSEIRQDDRGRRSDPELLSRRPQGRDRQGLALWRGGLRRSAQACRRHQGQAHAPAATPSSRARSWTTRARP